jgi:hypothetical protein
VRRYVKTAEKTKSNRAVWDAHQVAERLKRQREKQSESGPKKKRITPEERARRKEVNKECWYAARRAVEEEVRKAWGVGRKYDREKVFWETYHQLQEEHQIQTETDRLRHLALTMPDPPPPLVHVPKKYNRPHPARLLEVGQSYFILGSVAESKAASGTIYRIGQQTGRLFTTNRCTEGGDLGMRVYRTK